MDGAEFRISPLTVKQVENWNEAIQAHATDVKDATDAVAASKALRDLNLEHIVCNGLNNASPGAGWTAEKLQAELDYILIAFLSQSILDFCGLRLDPEAAPKPGENQAA